MKTTHSDLTHQAKPTARCSRVIEDPKARHCGIPGTPFDNKAVKAEFEGWMDGLRLHPAQLHL